MAKIPRYEYKFISNSIQSTFLHSYETIAPLYEMISIDSIHDRSTTYDSSTNRAFILQTASWSTLRFNSCLDLLWHSTCNHGDVVDLITTLLRRTNSAAISWACLRLLRNHLVLNFVGLTLLPYYSIEVTVTFPPCSYKPPLHSVNSLPLPILCFPFTVTGFLHKPISLSLT